MLHAGALWDGLETGVTGRVAVLGSSSTFDDSWLGMHSNSALLDWLLSWLQQARFTETLMQARFAADVSECMGPVYYCLQ